MALTLRIVLAVHYPLLAGDQIRYKVPAVNMLAGRGFSFDIAEPYLPSEHTVPLYPIFISGVYSVFGERELAVRIAQDLLDLVTCLLVAFIAFSLAPPRIKRQAAIAALVIFGLLSWFTVHWTRTLLTETLAIFMTTAAISAAIVALRRGRRFWLLAGAFCGLALLTRADSVLLVSAFLLFLLLQMVWRRSATLLDAMAFGLAILVVLAPWTLRNYVSLRRVQPLASEYGFARDGYMPPGYLRWLRTWMTDETHFAAFDPVFLPGSHSFSPSELPESVFDSAAEKARVLQLFDKYDQTGQFTPELSDEFDALARDRIRRAPLRFFLWLPVRRVASVWLTGFATHNQLKRLLRIVLALPILIGGVLGFAIWARGSPVAELLLLVILTRTVFLAYHYAPEARYIVEAYPAMIAACGVTCAGLWQYLKRMRQSQTV